MLQDVLIGMGILALPAALRWICATLYVAFALFVISLPVEQGALAQLQDRYIAEFDKVA